MKAPECGLRSADVSVCPLQRAHGRLSEQPACLQPRHSQSVHSDTLGVPSMNVVNNLIIRGCALSTIETHGRLCGEIHDGGGGKGVSLEPEANMQSEFLVHLLILTQGVIKRGFCSSSKRNIRTIFTERFTCEAFPAKFLSGQIQGISCKVFVHGNQLTLDLRRGYATSFPRTK